MNSAHLHLMVVHLPIILVPLGAIVFAFGLWRDNKSFKLVALNIFIFSAIFAGAAFLLGEGAEDVVEDLAGVAESAIEGHEDSALVALWLTSILGVLSLVSLIAVKYQPRFVRLVMPLILVLSLVSSAALAYTAQEGGKIRHPEAFDSSGKAVVESGKGDRDNDRD